MLRAFNLVTLQPTTFCLHFVCRNYGFFWIMAQNSLWYISADRTFSHFRDCNSLFSSNLRDNCDVSSFIIVEQRHVHSRDTATSSRAPVRYLAWAYYLYFIYSSIWILYTTSLIYFFTLLGPSLFDCISEERFPDDSSYTTTPSLSNNYVVLSADDREIWTLGPAIRKSLPDANITGVAPVGLEAIKKNDIPWA